MKAPAQIQTLTLQRVPKSVSAAKNDASRMRLRLQAQVPSVGSFTTKVPVSAKKRHLFRQRAF